MRIMRRIAAVSILGLLAAGFVTAVGSPAGANGGVGPVASDSGFECVASDGLAGINGEQVTTDSSSISVKVFGRVIFARLTCTFHLESDAAPNFTQFEQGFGCEFGTDHGLFFTYNTTAVAKGSLLNGAQPLTTTCTVFGGLSASATSAAPAAVSASLD